MASQPLHRPITFARRGMVVAPHYLATEAGLELLKAGGNALDAAVAASAMLQVVYPFVCGLGGDVFMIIYDAANGKLHGLNGIVLQNRGAYFSLDPNSANALAPAKRTLHTLIPSMALRAGRPAMVFGTMGGDGQAQTHLQVYTAVARFELNIQAAIEMPRWLHGAVNGAESLRMESRFSPQTLQALRQRGHSVEELGAWETAMGVAQGITFDPSTGIMQGGADPRAESLAAW